MIFTQKLTAYGRTKIARHVAIATSGVVGFGLLVWLAFEYLPQRNPLDLRFIEADVVDVRNVDDGKGDKREIVVRFDSLQLMFQTADPDINSNIGATVCIKQWSGTAIPDAPTSRYQRLVHPTRCDKQD